MNNEHKFSQNIHATLGQKSENSLLLIYAGSCQCKEGFHGNGTENCIPDGFDEEANGKHYKMFDDKYVEFEEAVDQCEDLGARYFRYHL